MKTEDFDDAIKRKLESISPTASEKDIERVHQYTLHNRGTFSLHVLHHLLWPMVAAGMLVTALVTWKLTSLYEQKATVANNAPMHQTVPMPPNEGAGKPIVKSRDTLYNPKYADKQVYKHPANNGSKSNALIGESMRKGQRAKPINRITGPVAFSNSKATNHQNENNGSTGSATGNNTAIANNTANAAQNHSIGSEVGKPNEKISPATDTASKNEDTMASLKKNAPKSVKKAPIHDYSAETKKGTRAKKHININFMAGIGGEGTNTQRGGGIFTKVTLNNRYSFNLGLKMMNVNNQSYSNDAAFEHATGNNFQWTYAPGLPSNCDVKDIQFTYALLQLPISLEYDLPLTFINNLNLVFSLGTDLDISCIGGLQYKNTQGYGGETYQQQNETNNYATVPFNNLFCSIGLIKQWHHFALELGPLVSQQVKTAWYKGNNATFYGGNIKVYYCF